MATISHLVSNALIVIMSEINSEAMFYLKLTYYLSFFLQVAIELQKSMEIQDGYHQPFCF